MKICKECNLNKAMDYEEFCVNCFEKRERENRVIYYSLEGFYFKEKECDEEKHVNFLDITCPKCNREFKAFRSKFTKEIKWDWVWVGCDHKQPEGLYKTHCRKCNHDFNFKLYLPQ